MRRLDSTPTVTGTFSMGKKNNVFSIKIESDTFLAASMPTETFDSLVDEGYDDILIITPRHRYIASIDEWLDYSYIDLTEGDVECRVMHKAYMGLV